MFKDVGLSDLNRSDCYSSKAGYCFQFCWWQFSELHYRTQRNGKLCGAPIPFKSN